MTKNDNDISQCFGAAGDGAATAGHGSPTQRGRPNGTLSGCTESLGGGIQLTAEGRHVSRKQLEVRLETGSKAQGRWAMCACVLCAEDCHCHCEMKVIDSAFHSCVELQQQAQPSAPQPPQQRERSAHRRRFQGLRAAGSKGGALRWVKAYRRCRASTTLSGTLRPKRKANVSIWRNRSWRTSRLLCISRHVVHVSFETLTHSMSVFVPNSVAQTSSPSCCVELGGKHTGRARCICGEPSEK